MTRSGGAPALHQQLEHTAGLLRRVRAGSSMPEALQQVPPPLRAGCQALGFHVMRWRGSAEAARQTLAPRKPAPEVDALLTCALALMWPLDAPPYTAHALVDEAVKCAARISPRSKGFVNAVLRQALRMGPALQEAVDRTPEGRHHHPAWWVKRLQRDWPTQAEAIMAASQIHPPLTLRANARRGGLAALGPALTEAGLEWRPVGLPTAACAESVGSAEAQTPAAPSIPTSHAAAATASSGPAAETDKRARPALTHAAVLQRAVPVDQIPGFAQGDWSVQDAAAQVAAPLLLQGLGARAHERPKVLDACAAPGGKTAHLLEIADVDLWALDADAQRLQRVQDTLQRLGLPGPGSRAGLQAVDARAVAQWWDGKPFDAILLDAPCSASGIVRRHPDARWLRRESDIAALARIQAELLDALWPLLRPGGCLLYATCSVFKAEGSAQIDAFLQRHGLPHTVIDPASPGHLLPLVDNEKGADVPESPPGHPACDGFFYALLHKT